MAVTHTHLTEGTDESNGTSYATASISPSTDKLLILDVASSSASASANSSPTVSGCGVTWVSINTTAGTGNDGPAWARQTMFRAMGTPTTGVLTVDFGSDTQEAVQWSLCEKGNVDTGGTNGSAAVVQSATALSTTTTCTVTLAAFGNVNNATHGAFMREGEITAATQTAGTGFTEQTDTEADLTGGYYAYQHTIYRDDNDTTVDSTSSDAMDGTSGIAIEIKESSVITGTFDRTEDDDTSTTTGAILVTGTSDNTEADDAITANGIVAGVISGTADNTEEDDTITAAGIYEYIGTADNTEEDDT